MIEEWRDSAHEKYEVSNLGRIRHKNTKRVRKLSVKDNGYLVVGVHTPKGVRSLYVHQEVAKAFIGPIIKPLEVAHNDSDMTNNVVGNLRITTHVDNVADRKLNGTQHCGEDATWSKLTWEIVRDIRANKIDTNAELGRRYNVTPSSIYMVRSHKTWKEAT